MEEKLIALLNDAAPQITEKEKEIENLRAALAYTYEPTSEEYRSFDEHSQAIMDAGGYPPDETEYWANRALMLFEHMRSRE